jgi:uncharacterized protein (DUF1800 family)
MVFDPHLAEIRFGTGLSPHIAPPTSTGAMIDRLTGPDDMARAHPIPTWAEATPSVRDLRLAGRESRDAMGRADEAAARDRQNAIRMSGTTARNDRLRAVMARHVDTGDGLRERLVDFWADHFTIQPRDGFTQHLIVPTIEQVIRPHVTARFADLLRAVIPHPMMLVSLDQVNSMGPNSPAGQRRGQGLNENLARELLELHTLGVGGPYGQDDVRELAQLLTGLSWNRDADPGDPPLYRNQMAEPGAETVLGRTFSAEGTIDTVYEALDALAEHPATAAHIARKLATHFVSDNPDLALVASLTDVFTATRGDLLAVTEALLKHPAAWMPQRVKVKQPFGFVASALRALGIGGGTVQALDGRAIQQMFRQPMTIMGQVWDNPPGPDGWPEEAGAWITPQGMAGRIDWALRVPVQLRPDLPDPREFVVAALGPFAGEAVTFAARAAESRPDGVGVILASADFQRR